ncbi:uroporphyrinogen-III synthase [Frigidibacter albus]|uniref:Uroporphyrinogen-III synthase n=1 Tax=Frigidibacter albus TaxID=1465486 RepID=A0A6L8VGL5_9RHOB|nr:uroporphyrinogen-III synthase [Frigidibacter albus]MZQ89497.1 uroporphyrinogen-III synthase [Frigidibacter albus]NBE31403.1 uroporphyrinogen-III synthase [Frigidibacter albus]GGH55638.1 uroporphyrinogen III methyltransferase [Frigidibacter albus]
MAQPTLLLTRPAPQSQRFAAECAARFPGVPVLISPLMQIVNLPLSQDVAGADALILTSENAALALAPQTALRPPAWCVGPRTATAARAEGFPIAGIAEDAASLTSLLKTHAQGATLLHARGRHVVADLPTALAPAGITVTEAMVYDQQACALTDEARTLLTRPGPILAPLFSPRSARLLAEAVPPRRLHIAAISAAVARAAEPLAPLGLELAARPDSAAMLEALGRLIATLQQSSPHGA